MVNDNNELKDLVARAIRKEREGIDAYKQIYRRLCAHPPGFDAEYSAREYQFRRYIVAKESHKAGLYSLLADGKEVR